MGISLSFLFFVESFTVLRVDIAFVRDEDFDESDSKIHYFHSLKSENHSIVE